MPENRQKIDYFWLVMVIPISLDFANQDTYPLGMKSLKDSLRKSLAHRHMGHQMVGAVALNTVRDFLGVQKHITSVDSVTSLDDLGEHDTFVEYVDDASGLE